jgi:hypothetical protein
MNFSLQFANAATQRNVYTQRYAVELQRTLLQPLPELKPQAAIDNGSTTFRTKTPSHIPNMSAAPTNVNVFNPTGPKKEGPSFQSSKPPKCPAGQAPIQRFRPDGPGGTKSVPTGDWNCVTVRMSPPCGGRMCPPRP